MTDELRGTLQRIINRNEDPTKLFSLFESAMKAERERCIEAVSREKRHHQDVASNLRRKGSDARYLDEIAAVGVCAHIEDVLRALT